jgi:zinc D-Ala-D-Ala carboxypeptidase
VTDERPRLGEFFTLAELMVTSTGLPNVPDARSRANLQVLVETVLDPLRRHVGRPVRVRSGFRSLQVNRAVGGSPRSAHLTGEASDIKADGLSALELLEAIVAAGLDFDQVIAYHPSRGGHVHVGIRAGMAGRHRRQLLIAPAGQSGYAPYTLGQPAPW